MNALANAWKELIGLFVDDGALAALIIAVVILAIGVSAVLPQAAGIVLVLGSLAALSFSLMRATR